MEMSSGNENDISTILASTRWTKTQKESFIAPSIWNAHKCFDKPIASIGIERDELYKTQYPTDEIIDAQDCVGIW